MIPARNNNSTLTLDNVKAALQLSDIDLEAAQAGMMPRMRSFPIEPPTTPPRPAGVLVLLYPETDGLHLLLTRRSDTLRGHRGQISFPGGTQDPEDASLMDTALRETGEELGIWDESITILGQLSSLYIPPTHFDVRPTVASIPALPPLQPNPDEVAEVFSMPLAALIDDTTKRQEYRQMLGSRVQVPYYLVHGHKVWGATAIMLSELEYRLRKVLNHDTYPSTN
jgi:8-oxo-dGTP pyrophosphatase MutT (NUDIX family)